MFRSLSFAVAIFVSGAALADPISDAKVIANSKNPIGAILSSSAFGCDLLGPPSPQVDLAGSPGPGAAGTITVPKLLNDGYTYDLSAKGQLCPLSEESPHPVIDADDPKSNGKIKGGIETISFKNEISAQLKLTVGTWLNLLDFDAQDLEEVGIYLAVEPYDYSEPKLRNALLKMRQENGSACSALTDSAARQIVRSCYGRISISLNATKKLSLNALDLKFANLVVGLKAKWQRDVKGNSTDCDLPGGGGAAPPPKEAAKPADGTTTAEPAKGAATPTKNGVEVSLKLPAGTVPIVPAPLNVDISINPVKVALNAPTAADEKKAVEKPQNPAATPDAVAKAKSAKPEQPAAQDKICASNVIYRTSDILIIGAKFLDAEATKKNQDWLKRQPR